MIVLVSLRWIVIYPVDSTIQRLNNRGLVFYIYIHEYVYNISVACNFIDIHTVYCCAFYVIQRGRDYTVMEQATLQEEFVRYLGIHKVHILAHDLGDTVALEMLAR